MFGGMGIREVLGELVAGSRLSTDQAESLFEDLLGGMLDDAQIGAALALIQSRGPCVEELVGAARVMRRHVTPIPIRPEMSGVIIDTCGTGGTGKTFNISTLAAIVVAGATPGKVRVAKHGNRSRSGRGSAELLAALGVNVDAPPAAQARCLEEAGVCFCFAIHHHPAAKHAAAARRSLGFPTIFNLLGPLTNPAGATHQLLGVYEPAAVELVAAALARLGARRALVVHGRDGIDEISTTDRTIAALVEDGAVRMLELDYQALGVPRAELAQLQAADMDRAIAIARGVLSGQPGAPRDIVILNAGAALWVAGAASTISAGMDMAAASIDSGAAKDALGRLIAVSAAG
jgi:anthranilate phosphoribosyltransferase